MEQKINFKPFSLRPNQEKTKNSTQDRKHIQTKINFNPSFKELSFEESTSSNSLLSDIQIDQFLDNSQKSNQKQQQDNQIKDMPTTDILPSVFPQSFQLKETIDYEDIRQKLIMLTRYSRNGDYKKRKKLAMAKSELNRIEPTHYSREQIQKTLSSILGDDLFYQMNQSQWNRID